MKTWFSNRWVMIGSILGTIAFGCVIALALGALILGPLGRRTLGGPVSRFDGPRGPAFFQEGPGRFDPAAFGPRDFGRPGFFPGGRGGDFGPLGFGGRDVFMGGPGLGGDVTELSDAGFTFETPSGDSVTVNTNDDTRVWLVETEGEGSLSDIAAGNRVAVLGRRSDDTVEARGIIVMPAGERGGGRVTAIDGNNITVEDLNGEATIVTSEDTQFRLGRTEGSLSDVTEGAFVIAFGEKQADGTLEARLVFAGRGGAPGLKPGLWY